MKDNKDDPVIFNLGAGETISLSDLNEAVISEACIVRGIDPGNPNKLVSCSILKNRDPNGDYSYKLRDVNFSDLSNGKLIDLPRGPINWEEVIKEAKESGRYAAYDAAHYRLSEVFEGTREYIPVLIPIPNPDKEPENKEITIEFTCIQITGPEVSELAKKMLRRLGPPPVIKGNEDGNDD